MKRRQFIKLAGMAGVVSLIYTPGGRLVKKVYGAAGKRFFLLKTKIAMDSGLNSLDDLIMQIAHNDFRWLDDNFPPAASPNPFAPPMDDNVLQANMDGMPNDHRFGWMHRYTVQTDAGMVPDISVSGNSDNLIPYVSVRPVPGYQNLYFVDLLFQTGANVTSDTVTISFSQVTGIQHYRRPEMTGSNAVMELYAAPNPFRSSTRIHYKLSRPAPVLLRLYNILGQVIFNQRIPLSGEKMVELHFPELATGIYLLQLIPENGVPKTIRIRVIK